MYGEQLNFNLISFLIVSNNKNILKCSMKSNSMPAVKYLFKFKFIFKNIQKYFSFMTYFNFQSIICKSEEMALKYNWINSCAKSMQKKHERITLGIVFRLSKDQWKHNKGKHCTCKVVGAGVVFNIIHSTLNCTLYVLIIPRS